MSNNTRGTKRQGNHAWQGLYKFPTENIWQSRFQNCDSAGTNGVLAPRHLLGAKVETYDGKVFRFVENASATAFAEGNILSQVAVQTLTSASTSADGLTVTGTFTATTYADEWVGGYLYIRAGTGKGVARRIVANDAVAAAASGTVTLERSIGTSLSSLTCAFRHPWRMVLTPAVITNCVHGVAIGVVSAWSATGGMYAGGTSYFGWAQTAGVCEKVLITGTTPAASTVLGILTPSGSVAGSATPIANGGFTPDDAWILGVCEGTAVAAAEYETGALARLLNME